MIVDTGVGSHRRAVVAKTVNGHFIITPDNGTLTHVKQFIGIAEVREIDETINRLPNSGDRIRFMVAIFAYTGARLAAGVIQFDENRAFCRSLVLISLPLKMSKFV